MASLFKYLPSRYVNAFLGGGILFRSLSYFREYEEQQVRGDRLEAVRQYKPKAGLAVNINGRSEPVMLPMAFEAQARERDILVFCLSTVLSAELAAEFNADACVEITEPDDFLHRLRRALVARPSLKGTPLINDAISYYDPEFPPLADWALPERIALSKIDAYRRQAEYRIAFGRRRAFDVSNVRTRLTSAPASLEQSTRSHPQVLLQIGDLRHICKTHTT